MSEIENTAEIFKALSDPTRLRIVQLMNQHGGALCVNALASRLNITQSAVSQHLKVLRHAGFVKSEKRGYFVHYQLDTDQIKNVSVLLDAVVG